MSQPSGASDDVHDDLARSIDLKLLYHPPLAWVELMGFLKAHELKGVEAVAGGSYRRTLAVAGYQGWLEASHPTAGAIALKVSRGLQPVLDQVVLKVRSLLDLDAKVYLADAFLRQDPCFRKSIELKPGLRLPGSSDIFELAWRTILGQQVSIAAASAIAARTIKALGKPIATPFEELSHLSPEPSQFVAVKADDLGKYGFIRSRQAAVQALAKALCSGTLDLDYRQDPQNLVSALLKLPGIGPWTANYIAMRGLNWSDGWPYNDGVLLKRMNGIKEPNPAWSPWRAYAAMRLWYP